MKKFIPLDQNSNFSNDIFSYISKQFPRKTRISKSLFCINSFKIEFLKKVRDFIFYDKLNFSINLNNFKFLVNNIKNNNITVATADKNVGITLIDNNLYNHLCFEHLRDSNTYEWLNFNPHYKLISETSNTLIHLNKMGHLSDKLFKILLANIKYKKLANFKILMKLHKENKFGVRPLINCSNTVTSVISKTIDFYLKPIVSSHFSFIKDSQNLIQKVSHSKFNPTDKLYSADFESLYTNIPQENSIEIIMEMISRCCNTELNPFSFYCFLKLVLLNNYFYFKHNNCFSFFRQIKGVAMGTACGPSVANLYLAYFEIKYKVFLNVSLYKRFIDDLAYTDRDNYLTDKFPSIFPNLILNTVTNNSIVFLDLNISFDHIHQVNF